MRTSLQKHRTALTVAVIAGLPLIVAACQHGGY